ncbi:MAG TPA: EthD family reductase [Saprospiraceae bacterium]|nr:EthD family reductase [Saprospiraceae bacterium]HRV84613.1 EthD family reductase [Saprospiraceae bacterium]
MLSARFLFLLLISSLIGLSSCKTNQKTQASTPEKGLFKVTILYPNGEGKTFDLEYYHDKHMPMVAGFIGKNLKFYEIDQGIAGRTPGEQVPYLAIGNFYVYDLPEYNAAIRAHLDTITGDFKNYTNIQPIIQISKITQLGYNK